MGRAQSNISYELLSTIFNIKERIFKIITEEEFTSVSWWYSDGSQPISNGETCYVINKDNDPRIFITCCSNCGDYTVNDMVEHTLEMEEKLTALKEIK